MTKGGAEPFVTVLMAVYNGQKYLKQAVDSVLGQTFEDFEFIIINDGSTDDTQAVIESYTDSRLVVVQNETNLGLARSLNNGLRLARGKYIARMDCDDISRPERLDKQVSFLEKKPDVAVCGSHVHAFNSKSSDVWKYPILPEMVKSCLIFNSSLAHPAVVIRKSAFYDSNLQYDVNFKQAQDYELWARASKFLKLANIDEVLLEYRLHEGQVGQKYKKNQHETANSVRRILLSELGVSPTPVEMEVHLALATSRIPHSRRFVLEADRWLRKLRHANSCVSLYSEPAFSQCLSQYWFDACNSGMRYGVWSLGVFWGSPLAWTAGVDLKRKAGFSFRCITGRGRL